MMKQFPEHIKSYYIGLVNVLVLTLLLTSCETVSIHKVYPETLISSNEKIEEASHLILTDGTFVSLEDKDVFYSNKHKNESNVIIVRYKEGYPVKDTVKNVTVLKYIEKTYQVTNVKEIFVKKRETDTKAITTSAILIAVGAGSMLIVYFVLHFLSNLNDHH